MTDKSHCANHPYLTPESLKVVRAKRGSKYKNKRVRLHGLIFDSIGEAARYAELKKDRTVSNLYTQVAYDLGAGIRYIADYVYEVEGNPVQVVVEDLKGVRTAVFRLKAKLFRERYGFPILLTKPMNAKKARVIVAMAGGKVEGE